MIEDGKVWAALLGVGFGFILGEVKEWRAHRRRGKAHWQALSAEAEICREKAEEFLRDRVSAPLYRLPTLSYAHSFPVLLADGATNKDETRAITQFYNEVETLNRGLDQSNETRDDEHRLQQEFERNQLKAKRLAGSGCYFRRIRAVFDRHVKPLK